MLASPLYGRFCLLARPALLSTCARLEAQIRPIPDALANFVFSRKIPLIDNGMEMERAQDLETDGLIPLTYFCHCGSVA